MRTVRRLAVAALVAVLAAAPHAHSQNSKTPARPWDATTPPPTTMPVPGAPAPVAPARPPGGGAPPAATAAPAAPVIARVAGRAITQREYDRIAEPYFARLRGQFGDAFKAELRDQAEYNVLNELIRRELMVVEAQRLGIEPTEAELDAVLRLDPFFYTNGTFDAAKLAQFRMSPSSNYRQILPQIREIAAADKFERQLRERMTPSRAAVREEWRKRNEQVRFRFLALTTRDVTLEPESSEAEQLEHYRAHPEQFERKPRLNLEYLRLPLPPADDTSHVHAEGEALRRGRGLADSLRAGASIDSVGAPLGGAVETGWFELPATNVPGLGRQSDLLAQVARAELDPSLVVLDPVPTPGGVVVAVVAGREPKRVPEFAEVRADVKRRADAEKRRTQLEADKRAYFDAHPEQFAGARAQVTRVLLDAAALDVRPPRPQDAERWYRKHARALFLEAGDSARAASPPKLDDSLRAVALARLEQETRLARRDAALARIATGWGQGRSPHALARAEGATADTLTFTKDAMRDSLFGALMVDSIVKGRSPVRVVTGPRRFGRWDVLWRVDRVDTAFVPSFDQARSAVDRAFADHRRQVDEDSARVWFATRRSSYLTPHRYALEYVHVRATPPDSIPIADAEIRRVHTANANGRFRRAEQVRARHILISTNQGLADAAAKARADSLLRAIDGGADFEDLARRFSQDPSNAPQGGDLGFFERERMVKEFSDTAFALPVGRVSRPVKTRFGWHLIRVEAKQAAGVRPLDEVRDEIRAELARARSDSLAERAARRVLRQIPTAGAAQAAAGVGGVHEAAPVAASESIPGLGMPTELADALPSLAVGRWAPRPYKLGDGWMLVRVTRRVAPAPAEFDEVKRRVVDDMKLDQRKRVLDERAAAVRAGLAAGASLDSLAAPHGGLKDSGLLGRTGFVPGLGAEPRVIDRAFALAAGARSDTIHVAQGVAWLQVEEKTTMAGATFERDRDALTQELQAKNLDEWLESKKKAVRIEILRADLRRTPPPQTRTVTTTIPG